MPGIFTQKFQDLSKDVYNSFPSAGAGEIVNTHDAVNSDFQSNPWFLAINNVNISTVSTFLQSDSAKTGLSIIGRIPGVSKDQKVYVNPKASSSIVSNNSGKTNVINTTPGHINSGEMTFSGGHNQTPSIIGLWQTANPPADQGGNTTSKSDNASLLFQSNSTVQGKSGAAHQNDPHSHLGGTKNINPDTGKTTTKNQNVTYGPQANNLASGSILKTGMEISQVINGGY